VRKHISNSSRWDPPPVEPGESQQTSLTLAGAEPGDIVTAAHAGLGAHFGLTVDARVTAPGAVVVIIRNTGKAAVDVGEGLVRAAIVQYV
jgi:hypothetical protein